MLSLPASQTQSMDGRKPWNHGAVRGAEHRRRDGKKPEGSRRWIAAIAQQYMDVLSEQPRRDEKHRGFAAQERRKHRVRCLAFFGSFLGNAKKEPARPQDETKLCT